MKRIDSLTYAVVKGERVVVAVSSVGFAPPMAVASGGQTPLAESHPAADAVTWRFTVTRDPGKDHRVLIGFEFLPAASDAEHYHVHVSGGEEHGYDAPDFYQGDGESMGLKFRVRVS